MTAVDEATELMLDQAGVRPGSRVLDVAAGASAFDSMPGAFDAAICRLGLMLLPDVSAALRRIRLALRPGGRFSAVVYDAPEYDLQAVLEDAGFADVEVEVIEAPPRLLVGGGRRS
jgi:SAM-dependent methyltransferase